MKEAFTVDEEGTDAVEEQDVNMLTFIVIVVVWYKNGVHNTNERPSVGPGQSLHFPIFYSIFKYFLLFFSVFPFFTCFIYFLAFPSLPILPE